MMGSIFIAMSKFVPLISSGVAGSLGVLHLPRLWLKVSLDARGKLADGYPAVGTGFDQMVLTGPQPETRRSRFLHFRKTTDLSAI